MWDCPKPGLNLSKTGWVSQIAMKSGANNIQQPKVRDICLPLDGHQSMSNNFQDKIALVEWLVSSDPSWTFAAQAMVIYKWVLSYSD